LKILNIAIPQLRAAISLHLFYAFAFFSVPVIVVFDGMVSLIEGDSAGPKLFGTPRYPQDGVRQGVIEGFSYVELQNLLGFEFFLF
jgi:hypothetical protein